MKALYILALAIFFTGSARAAESLKGSLGYLPVIAETKDKGILVDFLKAMQKAYPEGKITFDVIPFKRSMQYTISGKTDFHAPILKDPKKTEAQLGFAFSTANIWDVVFALYTNKSNKDINLTNLSKYRIETDAALTDYFDFPVQPSSCLDCSLQKVNSGRIDGYIFAAMESDSVIKKLNLKNIKSVAYGTYEGKFVLPLGEQGKKTDAILTKIFARTKKNGDYDKILGKITSFYKNWKPIQ